MRYYQPFRQSAADLSHNIANLCNGVLTLVHPPPELKLKWRKEADVSGRHTQIGTRVPQFIDADVAVTIRDLDVYDAAMRVSDLRELAKIVGVPHSGNKVELQLRLGTIIQTIRDTGTAVVSVGCAPIPWVFTQAHLDLVNGRFRRLVIPHEFHSFCNGDQGLFEDRSSCWRMVSKMQVFFMLPVLFMGTIENLVASLTKLVHGLKLLYGRVISEKTRRDKGLKTCFHHISFEDWKLSKLLLPESLSEYANIVPSSCMKSHAHPVIHYPDKVDLLGPLPKTWMFGDERRNKVSTEMYIHLPTSHLSSMM